MHHVHKPKARTMGLQGFTIDTTNHPIDHSPVTDSEYENPFAAMTPRSENGSAFEPVSLSPPNSSDQKSYATPSRTAIAVDGKHKIEGSPCESTQASTLRSHDSPLVDQKEKGRTLWRSTSIFKSQLKQIKKNLPKALQSMTRSPSKKNSIDLSDLAVATICVVPRHGAGIAVGRKSFERMRTSTMLHMIEENQHVSWESSAIEDLDGDGATSGKAQIAKLNTRLRNSIASNETCFAEKCQETARLAKNTLEVRASCYNMDDLLLS